MANAVLGGGLMAAALGGILKSVSYLGDDLDTPGGNRVESVSYAEFVKEARTGDLILTSCPTSVSRIFTKSLWSHCGMVWRDASAGGKLYEWSSHTEEEAVMNSNGGTPTGGSQLVPLEYLASDNGAIFWRQVGLDDGQVRKLDEFVGKFKYKLEFSSFPELLAYLGPVMAKFFNGYGTGMVCSHTVAATYMAVEALTNDRHLSQFCPETFAPTGDASWLVPVSETVKMVVGFDTRELISIPRDFALRKL